jgi:hypothetical protein
MTTTQPANAGDRIVLVHMGVDPSPIAPGTVGTVTRVTPWISGEWNIGVEWDNGRTLGLVIPEDRFVTYNR